VREEVAMKSDAPSRPPARSVPLAQVVMPWIAVALAAGAPAHAGRHPLVVRDTTYRVASDFGPDTLLVRELGFESPVLAAEVIEVGDAIVITTGSGIASLSTDSLKVMWSRRCGRMLALEAMTGFKTRYSVSTQGLILLDASAGLRPSAYYPLRGSWAEFKGGWLMVGAGTTLKLVTLVEHRPPLRVD
jgi:hypothetical protein